jgi:hypothetical protein
MTGLATFPGLLAEYFEIEAGELEAKSVSDPGSRQLNETAVAARPID